MSEHAELVHHDVADGVATLTLDSPHNRNALSRQLVRELLDHLDAAEADDDVRVVLLAATGHVFCAGADLSEAAGQDMAEATRTIVGIQRRLLALDKPVVARVQGAVRAGGTGVVAAADVAICAREASFAVNEVRLALAPAAISFSLLPRLSSRAAAWVMLGGEPFDGDEAAGIGLVTRAVAAEGLDDAVAAACASLAAGAPQGLRETKRLLNADLVARIDAHGEEVAALSARLFGSEEARAAMNAFLQRKN